MERRSEEERQRIRETCLRIEKAGGDVLEFLRGEHYISPRATWINMQREIGRKIFTDGRPKEKEERGTPEMKERKTRRETLQGIIDAKREGKNAIDFLREEGYKDPAHMWQNLKVWARKNAPDLVEEMVKAIAERIPEIRPKQGGDYKLVPPEEAEKPKGAPWIEKKPKPLEVAAVYSRVMDGRTWRKTADGMAFCGQDGTIVLNAWQWLRFSEEILQAIRQLEATPAVIGGDE